MFRLWRYILGSKKSRQNEQLIIPDGNRPTVSHTSPSGSRSALPTAQKKNVKEPKCESKTCKGKSSEVNDRHPSRPRVMPSRNRQTRTKAEKEMVANRQSTDRKATRQSESKRSEERSTRRSSNEFKSHSGRVQEKFTGMLGSTNQTARGSRAAKRKQSDSIKEEPASKKSKSSKSDLQIDELSNQSLDSESETTSSDTDTSDDDTTRLSDEGDDETPKSRDDSRAIVEESSKDSNSCKEVSSVGDDDEDSRSVVSRKSDGSSSIRTSIADDRALDPKLGDEDWNLDDELQAISRSRTRTRRRGAKKRNKRDRSSQSEDSSIDTVRSGRKVIQTRNGILFQVNERLEAMDFQDKWYAAKIIDVDNEASEILIHFENWNSRYDEWVPMDSPRLRPLAHPSTRRELQAKSKKIFRADFRVGEAVLARWTDCKLYQAHIKEVLPDGNYEVIFYDGFQRKLGPMNIHKFTEGSEYKTMEPGEFKEAENDDKGELENDDSSHSGKPEVVAPKEFVVEEDHNQYKCPDPDCSKGFRKEALLLSHIKHYHSGERASLRRHRKESVSSVVSEKSEILSEREQRCDDNPASVVEKSNQTLTPLQASKKTYSVAESFVPQLEPPSDPVKDEQTLENTQKESIEEEKTIEITLKDPPIISSASKSGQDVIEDVTLPVVAEVKDAVRTKEEKPLVVPPPPTPPKVLPMRISKKTYPVTKMETRHAKLCFFKEDFSYLKEAKYLKSSGHRGEAIGRTQKGFVGKQGMTRRNKPKESDGETKKRSPSGKTEKKSENLTNIKSEPADDEEVTTEAQPWVDEGLGKGPIEPASVETPPADDEVVRCICECNDENGLMIQCEVCMAWQHGICFDIERVEQVPEKYICYLCTEPLGLRKSFRYKYDQDWFKKGELATFGFLKEDPLVANQSEAILATHELTSSVHDIANVLHSLQHKINILQSENSPDLQYWSNAWTSDTNVDATKCGGSAIARCEEDVSSFMGGESGAESQVPKSFTTFDHSYFSPKQDSVVAMLTGPQEFAAEAVISTSPSEVVADEDKFSQDGQVPNTVALDHGYAEEVAEGEPGKEEEVVKVDVDLCKRNLTEHVKCMQQEMSDHLDAVEELLGFLEVEAGGSEDSFQGAGDADDFQDLMKSIRNLSQDLHTVQRFTRYQ